MARSTREKLGEKAYEARLKAEGLTEDSYLDHVVGSMQLDYTLTVEKIVRYNQKRGESFRIDRMIFSDDKDAETFSALCKASGFDAARDALKQGAFKNAVTQHLDTLHTVAGPVVHPPLDPWILDKLRAMLKGGFTGVERTQNNRPTVIRLIEHSDPQDKSYQELKDEILESILKSPPDATEAQRWVNMAAGKVSVEMKKR